MRGIRVVKAFGREQEETAKVEHVTARAYRYSMSRARLLARYDGAMKAVPIITQAALLAVGAWRLSLDALSLGTFLLAFQLGTGLASLASIFDELASALAVPPRCAGPPRRDARAELASHHRRPHGAGTVDRARGRRPPPCTFGNRELLHGLDAERRAR